MVSFAVIPEGALTIKPTFAFSSLSMVANPTSNFSRLSAPRLPRLTKCDRSGRYHVHKLIEKYGRNGNMMKWREMLNADCPKRDGRLNDRCDLICPDLSKAL
jgi:hypothetical protein